MLPFLPPIEGFQFNSRETAQNFILSLLPVQSPASQSGLAVALWSLVTYKLGFMLTAYCSPSPPHSAQAQIQYIAAYQGAGKLPLSFSFKKGEVGNTEQYLSSENSEMLPWQTL